MNKHKIEHHLAVLWMDTCRDLETARGGHEGMILTEQRETLERFLDNPAAHE